MQKCSPPKMSLRYSSKVPQCASWALQIHYSSKLCQGSWATLCEKVWWSMWTCPHRSSSDKSKNNLSVARIKGSIWWWQLLMTAFFLLLNFTDMAYLLAYISNISATKRKGCFLGRRRWPSHIRSSFSVNFTSHTKSLCNNSGSKMLHKSTEKHMKKL